ncbi:putative exported protein [Halobacteriovorax marinus SJ]|uniref:Exported protein n=1 Tax=Halobacteriovorax marinus (strain ATCC BAA-682 / DSM 15412 / SJ) TaxID=862908 RepID=E1WZF4_HALMS|nr:DUF1499 domain-containing protein [Halobacteriovorax marinus]CBW27842.1 putative exported protein [Halobacteriovorax marinus SJ]
MKKIILILITAILTASCIDNKEPEGLGISVKDFGTRSGFSLKECHKKSCVNSRKELTDEKQFIEPIKVVATKEIAYEKIMKIILKEKDLNVVNSTENYIRAKQTLYGKLITDVEFFFTNKKTIYIRAEMRGVPYDLGNSRRLLENIRFKFHQNDY